MDSNKILGSSWGPVLAEEFKKFYMKNVARVLAHHRKLYNVFPESDQVFRAFHLTPYEEVKVVILGQDPYPTPGYANGLAFSYNPGDLDNVHTIPKSLKNIFTEIEEDLGFTLQHNPDLSRWAKQGVLLLNTCLTVVEGISGSHSNIGWENFTRAVIEKLNDKENQIVYLLWGKHAQSYIPYIKGYHEYLIASHPSPLSYHRGFKGCRHFSNCNEILKNSNQTPINWTDYDYTKT